MFDLVGTYRASSLQDALALLSVSPETIPVAGGTDVMIKLRNGALAGSSLVGIGHIKELRGIHLDDSALVIGAGERFSDISASPLVLEKAPALAWAASQVGGHEIRNVATIGGNICNGAVSADSAAPLLVYEASLVLASAEGTRQVPVASFYQGPGKTVRKGNELALRFEIPRENTMDTGSSYIKFGQRNAMEIATLGCAALVRLTKDKRAIDMLHLAFTVAGPVPVRCRETERRAKGLPVKEETLKTISSLAPEELTPRDSWRASKAFRLQLARELAGRATEGAIIAAGGTLYA